MQKDFSIYSKLKTHRLAFLIFFIGLILRIWAACLDPFLHDWDERFHALVARNMMHHPFQPMLRAHPVNNNYDPTMWCCSHIWIHKPPLFLWQMAISMKMFVRIYSATTQCTYGFHHDFTVVKDFTYLHRR